MKKMFTAALFAAAMTLVPAAYAADASIGVVDTQKVLSEANAAKAARDYLQKQTEVAQKKINDMETKLVKQQEDLKAKRGVLSAEKFAEEEEKLKKAVREFRTEAQSIQANLDKENSNRRNKITDAIRTEIAALAKEKGLAVVVAENLLLYDAGAQDLTAEVLTRVNAKVK